MKNNLSNLLMLLFLSLTLSYNSEASTKVKLNCRYTLVTPIKKPIGQDIFSETKNVVLPTETVELTDEFGRLPGKSFYRKDLFTLQTVTDSVIYHAAIQLRTKSEQRTSSGLKPEFEMFLSFNYHMPKTTNSDSRAVADHLPSPSNSSFNQEGVVSSEGWAGSGEMAYTIKSFTKKTAGLVDLDLNYKNPLMYLCLTDTANCRNELLYQGRLNKYQLYKYTPYLDVSVSCSAKKI